jgi:hypothetical protein
LVWETEFTRLQLVVPFQSPRDTPRGWWDG